MMKNEMQTTNKQINKYKSSHFKFDNSNFEWNKGIFQCLKIQLLC